MSGILWVIIVGFVAGIIARMISPGPNNPSGFILTVVLGIAGAFLATFIGQMIGHYGPDQGAGFITASVPVLTSATISDSNDFPLPACGASISPNGMFPSIAGRN